MPPFGKPPKVKKPKQFGMGVKSTVPLDQRPGRRVGQYRKAGLTPPPPPGQARRADFASASAQAVPPQTPAARFLAAGVRKNPNLRGRLLAATRGRGKKRGLRRRGY